MAGIPKNLERDKKWWADHKVRNISCHEIALRDGVDSTIVRNAVTRHDLRLYREAVRAKITEATYRTTPRTSHQQKRTTA